MNPNEQLTAVLDHLKTQFIDKEEIVDLMGLCLVARENIFLLGPPGTAKSALVRGLSENISDGKNFEYLLTRFTEPNEIFGPFDIRKLKEGDLVTNTSGMLPEATMVFLDELFNANSAILNSLLMVLNERIFRRGREERKLPALMFVGASNQLPEEESLEALLDRFLIRVVSNNVNPESLEKVLIAGWNRERGVDQPPKISADNIRELQKAAKNVDLVPIRKEYLNAIQQIRNAGIKVSDRKAVKLQNLIASSAIISGRTEGNTSDLWVLRYIWDTEDQIEILAGIVETLLSETTSEQAHPQSVRNQQADAELLAKDIEELTAKWLNADTPMEERVKIKDQLRFVQSRCDWLANVEQRNFLKEKIDGLWKHILETV